MSTNYKAIKVNGKKKDLHRHLMEVKLGRKLCRHEVVHHKDGNKLNNVLENLELMNISEHSRLHMTGKKLSDETKYKLKIATLTNRPKSAKLSFYQVAEIKSFLGKKSYKELASMYKVSKNAIQNIKSGCCYSYIRGKA